ncbi:MAG: hypothetical protein LBD30_00995 [Verrucomicrobiales bacterium]|jgi:hypothetical protein|nr:hypothetical protein [Verrucomicrobiales bacterium]
MSLFVINYGTDTTTTTESEFTNRRETSCSAATSARPPRGSDVRRSRRGAASCRSDCPSGAARCRAAPADSRRGSCSAASCHARRSFGCPGKIEKGNHEDFPAAETRHSVGQCDSRGYSRRGSGRGPPAERDPSTRARLYTAVGASENCHTCHARCCVEASGRSRVWRFGRGKIKDQFIGPAVRRRKSRGFGGHSRAVSAQTFGAGCVAKTRGHFRAGGSVHAACAGSRSASQWWRQRLGDCRRGGGAHQPGNQFAGLVERYLIGRLIVDNANDDFIVGVFFIGKRRPASIISGLWRAKM